MQHLVRVSSDEAENLSTYIYTEFGHFIIYYLHSNSLCSCPGVAMLVKYHEIHINGLQIRNTLICIAFSTFLDDVIVIKICQ